MIEAGTCQFEQVKSGRPGEVIAEVACEEDPVAMSSLGATGIAQGAHRGSVADYVVRNANPPVLVVASKGYLGAALE